MTDPLSAPTIQPQPDRTFVVIRILLAIVLGIPGLIGALIFYSTALWASSGPDVNEADKWVVLLFVFGSLCIVSFSVIAIGIILRFARSRLAPTMSLLLALFSAATIAVAYQVSLRNLTVDNSDNRIFILAVAIFYLLIVSLPPLLHWFFARGKARV